jgi:hypothetical protein
VVKMKVILGVCNPCYNKPETVECAKKRRQKRKRLEEHAPHRAALTPTIEVWASAMDATTGCTNTNYRGMGKCYDARKNTKVVSKNY